MTFSKELKEHAAKVWEDGYSHSFVQGIGSGTLERDKFQFYLLQDYHYLIQYAKVFALAAIKSNDEQMITRLSKIQYNILAEEMDLHRSYMKEYGITEKEIDQVRPSLYNRTYTANMLAVGQTGDLAEILAAVFPCAWTYWDYAKRLKKQYSDCLEGNFYQTWIENYASDEFGDSFAWFFQTIDQLAAGKTDSERQALIDIFVSSVEFEYLFWDMAYKKELSYQL